VDGLFFDIVFNPGGIDFSEQTLRGVADAGLDPGDDADVIVYNERQKIRMAERLNSVLRRHHPGARTVFYNGGAELNSPDSYGIQSHFELEDLPTFWGGYNKFPLKAKYFALRSGKPCLAMSGKFHTMWGEFGGFKHPDAITYEVAHAVAFGAGCSFRRPTPPVGKMEMATYRNIGCGYRYLDRIAPYGIGGAFYSDLGLLPSGKVKSDQGISSMLLEEHLEFEVIERDGDWAHFRTIIVPDGPLATTPPIANWRIISPPGARFSPCTRRVSPAKKAGWRLTVVPTFLVKPDTLWTIPTPRRGSPMICPMLLFLIMRRQFESPYRGGSSSLGEDRRTLL